MKTYSELKGDGGSHIIEQLTSQRREINRRLSGVKHILAIGSGKGGVGKSTMVMRIACALARRKFKVSVIDADINGPCQAKLAGVEQAILVPGETGLVIPKSKNGIGIFSFATLFGEGQAVEFKSLVRGDSQTWRATREFSALAEILASTDWGKLDFLLIDLPPGSERTVQFVEFFGAKTKIVLVTIPSALARGVVQRSIDALRSTPNEVLGYVENMSGYYCKDCAEVKPLFPTAKDREFGIPCLGAVPFDPDLASQCDRGILIDEHPTAVSALAVQTVTDSILKTLKLNLEESNEISVC